MPGNVIVGTWEEIARHAEELAGKRLQVTILDDDAFDLSGEDRSFAATATNEEWLRMLDAVAEENRGLPVLSDDAFDRETLYEERF